jgi:uncharacterized protein YciI
MRLAGLALAAALGVLAARPALAQPASAPAPQALFVVVYKAGPAWKPGLPATQQPLGAHGAYMTRLAKEGTLVAGGPFADADGGLALLRAPDAAAARAILAADPAVTGGVMVGEIRTWTPFLGAGGPLPIRAPATKP